MSDSEGVRVTIEGDASGFTQATQSASDAAQRLASNLTVVGQKVSATGDVMQTVSMNAADFAAALREAGNRLDKIDTNKLGLGSDAMAQAIMRATAVMRAQGAELNHLASAEEVAARGFKSAGDAADYFLKLLNPTPLQLLRKLMGDEIPPAFRLTQNATLGVVEQMTGLSGEFNAASASAELFARALGDVLSPTQKLNALMNENIGSLKRTAQTIHEAISEATGLGTGFKSAGDSAAFFSEQINHLSAADLRAKLSEVASAGAATFTSLQQNIEAANRIGAAFHVASESATVFATALGGVRSPAEMLRSLMEANTGSLTKTSQSIHGAIAEATGLGTGLLSAADSAAFFAEQINAISASDLRAKLTEAASAGAATFTSLQQNIEAANGIGVSFASASESAHVFATALGDVKTHAQTMKALLDQDIGSLKLTSQSIHEAIGKATGLGAGFMSAASSADFFRSQIEHIPLADLRAKLTETAAAGQVLHRTLQENIAAANRIGTGFHEAAESAHVFEQALNPSPLQKLRDLMGNEVPAAAGQSSLHMGMLTREFIVLGHEAVTGNWTRIPGSLMVLTEYSDTARNAIARLVSGFGTLQIAGVAAAAAVALAMVHLAHEALAAAQALREVGNAAAFMGHSVAQATQMTLEARARLGDLGASSSDVDKASLAVQRLAGSTPELRKNFLDLLPALKAAFHGEDVDKYFNTVIAAAAGGAGGVRKYLEEADLLNKTNIAGLDAAERDNNKLAAQKILYDALSARLAGYNQELQRKKAIADELNAVPGAGGEYGVVSVATLPKIDPLKLPQSAPQVDPEQIRQLENEQKLLSVENERAALQRTIADEAKRAADATDPAAKAHALAAQAEAQAKLDRLASAAQQDAYEKIGEAAREAADKSVLAARAAGKSREQITIAETQAEIGVWQRAAQDMSLTERQRLEAKSNVARLSMALAKEETGQDATMSQEQQVRLNAMVEKAIEGAKTTRSAALAEHQAKLQFWEEEAKRKDLTEKQITAAQVNAGRARIALQQEELRGQSGTFGEQTARLDALLVKVAATAHSSKQLALDESKTRIAFWDQEAKRKDLTEGEITHAQAEANRARLQLQMQELRGGEQAAKQSLETKVAALSAEQAANRDNYAKVMALEAQKLALLKAAGANYSKQYQQELKHRADLEHQHNAELMRIAEEGLRARQATDNEAIGEEKARLQEEVDAHRISKAEMMRAERAFLDAKRSAELAAMGDTLATFPKESEAYAKLLDDMTKLKQKWAREDAQLNRAATQDLQKQWEDALGPVTGAFNSHVDAVLRGNETIGVAIQRMTGDAILSYIKMGVQAALHWAAAQASMLFSTETTEVAKTGATVSGAAARTVVGTHEAAMANTTLLGRVARWVAMQFGMTSADATGAATRTAVAAAGEAGKTGASAAGTATRAGIRTADQASENAGLLVRVARWIASELGLTSATEAQSAVRTATKVASAATELGATSATNVAEAMGSAAVGAAAAGASVAAIPYVGWAMAPEVAAGTYGMLSGFAALASLDVGAWNLPRDMPAQLHRGEMVIPANFAEGLRSNRGGEGGGGGMTYAPTIHAASTGTTQDLERVLGRSADAMKSYLWNTSRNGNLALFGR